MGSGASLPRVVTRLAESPEFTELVRSEAEKPLDASDVATLEEARSELARLRASCRAAQRACLAAAGEDADAPPTEITIITGPPAGGKGTQCVVIKELLGCVHLSTGDMLRENVRLGTALGKQAMQFMSNGQLVPDDVIIAMVLARLEGADCRASGALLDGFPRTPAQAEALSARGIVPAKVVALQVDDDQLVKRVVGRRLDPETGTIYHLDFKPPPPELLGAGKLVVRSDDTEEKARERIKTYKQNYAAIASHYAAQLSLVDGNRPANQVSAEVVRLFRGNPTQQTTGAAQTTTEAPSGGGQAGSASPPVSPKPSPSDEASPRMPLSELGISQAVFVGEVHLVLVLGPPAGGVGTQCAALKERLGYHHLSTGDILRDHVRRATELGKAAFEYMERGELVPDRIVIGIVIARLMESDLAEQGCLLDGFPRTLAQAEALSAHNVRPAIVVVLDLPDGVAAARVPGRRLDPQTGAIYHLEHAPPPPLVAAPSPSSSSSSSPEGGGAAAASEADAGLLARLVKRSDDEAQATAARLAEWGAHKGAIAAHYSDEVGAELLTVNGDRPIPEVTAELVRLLKEHEA